MMLNLPNLITIGNLTAGTLGIMYVLENGPQNGFWFVAVAVFLDFFDGMAARKLHISGDFGKQLDSLADMVSFGVLPGVTVYTLIEKYSDVPYLPYVSLLIVAFSALRLAKFNIDTRQSDTFYGLPTPSNALFFTSLPFIEWSIFENPYVLSALVVLFSYLLIAELKMFALKFKNFSWAENKWKYGAIFLGIAVLAIFHMAGIALVIAGYIVFSLVRKLTRK